MHCVNGKGITHIMWREKDELLRELEGIKKVSVRKLKTKGYVVFLVNRSCEKEVF